MGDREFLHFIKGIRNKLNMHDFLQKLLISLGICGAIGMFLQGIAFILPFYHVNLYTVLVVMLGVFAAIVASVMRPRSMEDAALAVDRFGFQERMITAYENLQGDHVTDAIVIAQRKDAFRRLQTQKDRIRIRVLPAWKYMLGVMALLCIMTVMAFLPSKTKLLAEEQHLIQEEVKEKKEEILKVTKELEKLQSFEQETLTDEQKAALQEMIDSLQASAQEMEMASTPKELAAAKEKLEYKYETMSSQLSNLAQSIQQTQSGETGGNSTMTAEAMQALAQQMQQNAGGAGQQMANGQGGQNDPNGQGGQSGQGGQNDPNGQGGQSGQGGQNDPNGQGGQGGQGGQNDPNGQGGQGGQGGQNGQNGGAGRGTGHSDAAHDYVSIPNNIADDPSLTDPNINHDASQYFRAPTGLGWEGTHMSPEAVIGSYQQNAYEGIAAGKYPSGMEDVIKDYFASFN